MELGSAILGGLLGGIIAASTLIVLFVKHIQPSLEDLFSRLSSKLARRVDEQLDRHLEFMRDIWMNENTLFVRIDGEKIIFEPDGLTRPDYRINSTDGTVWETEHDGSVLTVTFPNLRVASEYDIEFPMKYPPEDDDEVIALG